MSYEKGDMEGGGGPPLPNDTPLISLFATPTIRRDLDRPSSCYVDVKILDQSKAGEIEAIVFQNYYTASITISMAISDSVTSSYVNVLENRKLMQSPYYENGSQDWVTINMSEFNDNYIVGKPLRIMLFQPSPSWINYEIKQICAVGKIPFFSNNKSPVADGGIRNLDNENSIAQAWKSCSLTSIIKADAAFLIETAARIEDKIGNDNSESGGNGINKLVQNMQKKGSLSATKTKKEKQRTKAKKVVSLPGQGGVKKEKVVADDSKEGEVVDT